MPDASPAPSTLLILAQLQRRTRQELRGFHKVTGLIAVTSFSTSWAASGTASLPTPPVHPECARRVRRLRSPPCADRWLALVKRSRRSLRARIPTCPIGLRCTCVPIRFRDQLFGLAKLVATPTSSAEAFAAAMGVLESSLAVARLNVTVWLLTGQLQGMRRLVTDLERMKRGGSPIVARAPQVHGPFQTSAAEDLNGSLVGRALDYLQSHYQRSTLSLTEVAASLKCNPRYLTTRFTEVVGQHMRAYLHTLRVVHACRLLINTDLRVKEIAHGSGFNSTSRCTATFRRHVGVAPVEYRRIFSASA